MNRTQTMKPRDNKMTADNKYVTVASRGQKFITCPHCWTDQRTDRDFCYRCGAEFFYLNETRNRNHA